MNNKEFIHETVDEFLLQERRKLFEDRKILEGVLNYLEHKQQRRSCTEDKFEEEKTINSNVDGHFENVIDNSNISDSAEVNDKREKLSVKYQLNSRNNSRSKNYNNQIEKERLASIFENEPYLFGFTYRSVSNRRQNKHYNRDTEQENQTFYERLSENKENLLPKSYYTNNQRNSYFSPIKLKFYQEDAKPRTMVRFGEFSPLNPAFRCSDKPFLGLGEYEERRKIFLEKKKKEYQQYLENAKNSKSLKIKSSKINEIRNSSSDMASQKSSDFNEILPFAKNQIEVSTFTKWQQDEYRQELDKQIELKKQLQQQQNEKQKRECENYELQEISQRQNLTRNIEEEFHKRINTYNIVQQLGANEKRSEVLNELDPRIMSRTGSAILKYTTETCAVDDIDGYRKMQQELYKRELAQQIEEKKRLKEQCKLRELEEDQKIEAKIKKEEEKLRLEYEKEQAEREYRANQKVQLEERLQENLQKIQKENEEKKNASKAKAASKPLPKSSNIYPTNHKFNNKISSKNVTFASQPLIHTIPDESCCQKLDKLDQCSIAKKSERNCKNGSLIIEAPYVLATKNAHNYFQEKNSCCNSPFQENRPPSPILPAVQTRNLLKAKITDPVIPLGVSMSKETRDQYIKEDNILSNLSEIRRRLLENQKNVCLK